MRADLLLGEIHRDIAHAGFQCCLHRPHEVVVLHDAIGAIEADRQKAAAVGHQRRRKPGHPNKRMTGDIHGERKALGRAVDHARMQVFARRKRDRMQKEIEAPPFLTHGLKHVLELPRDAHVARHHEIGTEGVRHRPNERFSLLVEIRHRKLGARITERGGAPCCDAVLVCNTHNEPALSCKVDRSGHNTSSSATTIGVVTVHQGI